MLTNKTINQAFDIILSQALDEETDRFYKSLEVPDEDLELSNQCIKVINKINRIYKNQILKKRINKAVPKFVAAVAGILLFASLALNPHVQAIVKKIFERIFGQYTQHEFYSDTVITEENFNYDIRPSYVPDGSGRFQIKSIKLSSLIYRDKIRE